MDDNRIEIVASLNIPKTVSTIKDDLEEVKKQLDASKALSIVCSIDKDSITNIQNQLNTLSKNLKLDIKNVNFGNNSNVMTNNVMDNIATSADKADNSIKKVQKSIADLDDKLLSQLQAFKPEFINNPESDNDGYINIEATKNKLEQLLKPLGEVSVVAKSIANDTPDGLYRLEASIVSNTGELKKLNLELGETEEVFRLISSTYSDKGIYTQAEKLEKNINSITQQYTKLKGEVGNFSTGIFAEIDKDGEKTIVTFESLNDHIKGLSDGSVGIEQVNAEMTALKGVVDDLNATLGQSQGKGFNRFQNAEIGAREFSTTLKQIDLDIKALDADNPKVKNLATSFLEVKQEVERLQNETNRDNKWLEDYANVNVQIRELRNNVATVGKELKQAFKADNNIITLENRIIKTSAALEDYANKNKKAVSSNKLMSNGIETYSEKWDELINSINVFKNKLKSGTLSDEDISQFKHLNEEIATFKKEADAAGLTINAFFRNMRTQLSYVIMQWVSIQGAIRIIKSMVTEVKDLDAAMINLKKVTDETDETYQKFIHDAQKQAAELHTTTTAVVEQTAEWAKLGFTIEEAQKLSRNSAIYALVGEVDNATAVSDLVTVLKAFNQTADESILTVDALNKLGNTFATDAKSLGEGIAVSASALAMAGNDLNQSLALITGGTEITQNARETGNAIKVISLRIRGMKGALEELNEETEGIESISKIQTQILNLTRNKVNIFNDDGSFKSTYEILKQISEIYNDLSDTSKASLTEILFGKVRANQGLAIIQAFQSGQIEKAYNTAVESAGSAQEEFDKLSEGIQAHINDLKQAFETLSNTIINSDLVKFVVDSATTILKLLNELIDTFGTLPTILAGIAAIGGVKGVGKLKPNMPKLVLLQLKTQVYTPQQRAFQLLEMPKAV